MTDDTATNPKRLPNPKICRTSYLTQTLDFSDCRVENPTICKHMLRFGSSFYCRHPERRSFEKAAKP
jgi:hypothetical protein